MDNSITVSPSYLYKKKQVVFAVFNVSFSRNNDKQLLKELRVNPKKQARLVKAFLNNTIKPWERKLAKAVIQIRNVAAIIQRNRPDVLMLAEFDNDGTGKDKTALNLFQQNYLLNPQSSHGAGGRSDLDAIEYPFTESFATNTGLLSGLNLDNNSQEGDFPNDPWGFGDYHGQYAFALLSKYPIEHKKIRTFQYFKWKDLQGAQCPRISVKSYQSHGLKYDDDWFDDKTWPQVRLSSKNHVDVPIIIPTQQGQTTIHLLLSHPTPPVFDLGKNQQRNAAEVQFWQQYLHSGEHIYDDQGQRGGLAANAQAIIMGDLNLDPVAGDGQRQIMQDLQCDLLLNQRISSGEFVPTSEGGKEFASLRKLSHPKPERLTSSFGLGVDHLIPSAQLKIVDSGIYWPTRQQPEHRLIEDPRVGKTAQEISSDHRLVWVKIEC